MEQRPNQPPPGQQGGPDPVQIVQSVGEALVLLSKMEPAFGKVLQVFEDVLQDLSGGQQQETPAPGAAVPNQTMRG